MARYNELLVGRFNRFVQKLFSMKGPVTMPQVSSELQMTMEFFNGVENRTLEGWNEFSGQVNVPGLAGNVASFKLRNPVGSNVIAVIEKLTMSIAQGSAPSTPMGWTITQPDAGDLNNVGLTSRASGGIDGRGQGGPVLSLSGQQQTLAFGYTWSTYYQAGTPVDMLATHDQELSIAPNTQLVLNTGNGATPAILSVRWRERFLEDSERST